MLELPPPFRPVALREVGDAFAHAVRIAAEEGAGTLVHVGRFDLAEFAVVLEPDEPLRQARCAFYAGMVALADAIAGQAPPEKPISFDWPDAIRVDGGLVGGGRLAWPADAAEDAAPSWLVFGAMVRIVAMGEGEPGSRSSGSALDQEGFGNIDAEQLVASFSRHFMRTLDVWQERGFAQVGNDYLARLVRGEGKPHDIDESGDLLVRYRASGAVKRRSLARALATASWLDPMTGVPRS
jgi:biotin-(acetyl-CoA carboxylase) ligase